MGPIDAYAYLAPLVDEPYCLTWDKIARLTDRQIQDIYYRPRDPKTGVPLPFRNERKDKVVLKPVATIEERKMAYFNLASAIGMKKEDIEKKWEEALPRIQEEIEKQKKKNDAVGRPE